jgi:hypothetical protein
MHGQGVLKTCLTVRAPSPQCIISLNVCPPPKSVSPTQFLILVYILMVWIEVHVISPGLYPNNDETSPNWLVAYACGSAGCIQIYGMARLPSSRLRLISSNCFLCSVPLPIDIAYTRKCDCRWIYTVCGILLAVERAPLMQDFRNKKLLPRRITSHHSRMRGDDVCASLPKPRFVNTVGLSAQSANPQ